ncbi:hypothetical protein ACFQ5J_09195 [Lacticaseibacillus baoqingensis]|uniref:Chromosome partition protein Smc n=1 Tax=Lacticaseibacillus baoqingensis TaxID=2486013 RepID=A0ABW4E853_9LACO|nr:hypothetical protein [Lacticaseibacillus baoqingensis]
MKFFKSRNKTDNVTPAPTDLPQAQEAAAEETATVTAVRTEPEPSEVVRFPADDSLESLMGQIARIADQYNTTRQALQNQLFAQRDKQQRELTDQEALLEKTQKTVAEATEQLTQLRAADTQDLETKLSEVDSYIEEAQKKVHHQGAIIGDLSQQLKASQQQQDELTKKHDALAKTQTDIVAKLHAEADPLKLLTLAESYRTKLEDLKQQDHDVATQQAKLADAHQQLTANKAQEDQQLAKLNAEIKRLNERKDDVTQQIKTTQSKQKKAVADLEKKLADAKHHLTQTQNRIQELNAQLSTSATQLIAWFGTAHQLLPLPMDETHHYILDLDAFLPKHADELAQIAQRLAQADDQKVGLFSTYFDINLAQEIHTWAAQNGLHDDQVEIINPLYQLQTLGKATAKPVALPQNIASKTWSDDHRILNVTLNDNDWQLRIHYNTAKNEQIAQIDYVMNDKMTKRSYFNTEGLLSANALFDPDGFLHKEEYFRRDGLVALIVNYRQGSQIGLELYNAAGILTNNFANTDDLTTWWLQHHYPQQSGLIGRLDNEKYRTLTKKHRLASVPFVSAEMLQNQDLVADLSASATSTYIVANHRVADSMIQLVDQDLQLLQLNAAFLPAQISSPKLLN